MRILCVSTTGSWGKRSPADYVNDYSGYGDDGSTYKASLYPAGKYTHGF